MSIQPRLAIDRRYLAAAFSAGVHLAALAALLLWHFSPTPRADTTAMTVVDLPDRREPDEPPPPPPPQPTPGATKSGNAGPPAPRAEAAPLAAALPFTIPTFAPAPVPATGDQPSPGAALAGSGTGAGGAGSGTGGSGGGGGAPEPPREGTEPVIVRGDFKPSDYPKALRATRPTGRTWTEVMVAVNGRPLSCRVERSSGTPLLDGETCRIIMQRFRFRPGRDANNKPVVAPFHIDIAWEFLDLNEE